MKKFFLIALIFLSGGLVASHCPGEPGSDEYCDCKYNHCDRHSDDSCWDYHHHCHGIEDNGRRVA